MRLSLYNDLSIRVLSPHSIECSWVDNLQEEWRSYHCFVKEFMILNEVEL
jgi:hypothetical protein